MIDASIPLKGLLINRNDENLKQQQARYYQQRMQNEQAEVQGKRRLSDLLPKAMAGDKNALNQVAGIDYSVFAKLDETQRKQAKDRVSDLGAAVRWAAADPAQRPQRWEQIINHYKNEGLDLSRYSGRPELAEQALMELGAMDEYLEKSAKPDIRATEPGGGLYRIEGDQVRVLVQPNDGSQPMGAPAQQRGPQNLPRVSSPEEARRLPPGSKFIMPDGRVGTVPGGPTASQSGGFPY